MTQRFATVGEFWQALQGESVPQPSISEALNTLGVSPSAPPAGKRGAASGKPFPQKPAGRPRTRILLPVLLALLLIAGVGAGLWRYAGTGLHPFKALPTPGAQSPALSPTAHPPAASPSGPGPYPRLATAYGGPIVDLQANVPSQMTLTHMQQKGGQIAGTFNGLHASAPYTGFLDTSRHIYFTVAGGGGHPPFNFQGSVQKNGALSGSFCQVGQDGACSSGGVFGLWNVAPA